MVWHPLLVSIIAGWGLLSNAVRVLRLQVREGKDSEQFRKHVDRLPDYFWMVSGSASVRVRAWGCERESASVRVRVGRSS